MLGTLPTGMSSCPDIDAASACEACRALRSMLTSCHWGRLGFGLRLWEGFPFEGSLCGVLELPSHWFSASSAGWYLALCLSAAAVLERADSWGNAACQLGRCLGGVKVEARAGVSCCLADRLVTLVTRSDWAALLACLLCSRA